MEANAQVLPECGLRGWDLLKIFVTTGSRSFPFDRLVNAVDNANLESVSPDGADVFVQTGSGSYVPKHVAWTDFLSRDEFERRMEEADLVITHGGTGAIIGAITREKRVVAVPRLAEFGEAVDNHQVELVCQFEKMGLIKACLDLERLSDVVSEATSTVFLPYHSNTEVIVQSIDGFIQEEILSEEKGGLLKMAAEGNARRMLVVSNMWPDARHPSGGIFVKRFVDQAESLGWACNLAVMKISENKIVKLIHYIVFYIKSFIKSLLGSYDVIYIHYPSFSAPAVLAAHRLRKRRLIVNVHGSDVLPVSARQEKMHRYTQSAIARADRVVVPSKYFAQVVIEKYGMDLGKVFVYPSGGIDPKVFHPLAEPKINSIKEELGLDPSAPTLCFAGRITEGKGWDSYLQAVAQVLAKGIKLNVLLIGSGDQDAQCKGLVEELDLTESIVRMGLQPQERLCELYNVADAFVFPGRRSESLGLVALEAMACGTPVIATDFAAPKYYIENGVNGIKVPVGDSTALAQAIECLIQNPTSLGVMRKGALRTAAGYSVDSLKRCLSSVLE